MSMVSPPTDHNRAWAAARMDFAKTALSSGALDAAYFAVADVIFHHPNDAALLREAGALHRSSGDLPQALAYLLRAQAAQPATPAIARAIAAVYRAAGQGDAAKQWSVCAALRDFQRVDTVRFFRFPVTAKRKYWHHDTAYAWHRLTARNERNLFRSEAVASARPSWLIENRDRLRAEPRSHAEAVPLCASNPQPLEPSPLPTNTDAITLSNTQSYRAAAAAARTDDRHREAMTILEAARSHIVPTAAFVRDLADLYVFHNDRPKAVALLSEALECGGMDGELEFLLLSLLNEIGAFTTTIAVARGLPPRSASSPPAMLLVAQARLATRFDRPMLVAAAAQRETGPAWSDAADAMQRIRTAIDARRPFAFSRYGDGEGRFLAYMDPERPLEDADRHAIGNSIWHNWFGSNIADADRAELAWLRAAVLSAIARADLLGVTTAARLQTDGAHFGYLACVEGIVAARRSLDAGTVMGDALLHLELHRMSPFYRSLLGHLDFIGVISPHPALAGRLARHLGIARWQSYTVPGEQRLPIAVRDHVQATHFPTIYRSILAKLKIPHPGAVFVVAAGLLGKVYCDQIRDRGGIALDIGSLADGWMGFNTRPGALDDRASWELP